jgi:TonB family protein
MGAFWVGIFLILTKFRTVDLIRVINKCEMKRVMHSLIPVQKRRTLSNALLFLLFFFSQSAWAQIDKDLINKTIVENQNSSRYDSIAKVLGLKGGDKVTVRVLFSVDVDGKIVDVLAKGPHEFFEQEALRIIKKVPDLTPAEKNGEKIKVRFAMPITFLIETEKQRKRREKREARKTKSNFP